MPDLVVNKNEKSEVIVQSTILGKSIENETNILEMKVIPDKPKTLNNEQIEVYVPVASYTTPGIIAFDERYFIISPETGKVIPRYIGGGEGGISNLPYSTELSKDDTRWKKLNDTGNPLGKSQYYVDILQVDHSFNEIHNIVVESKTISFDDVIYENIIYSYRRLKSGTIRIILDNKIDCKISIEGAI